MSTGIAPLEPPYDPDVGRQLAAMMPADTEPIALFRTFAHNMPMTVAMNEWGKYELGRTLSLSMRQRELVIDRTCARCGCEYEWGVHVAYFAERVDLTAEQIASLTHGSPRDDCWTDPRDAVLLEAVDQLHDTGTIDDALWSRFAALHDDQQLLDLTMLCGWYHAISFAANASRVPRESFAPRFSDYAAP